MNEGKLKDRFGRRVRSLRRLRDITQADLAERTGLSIEYVSKVERGLTSPSFASIGSIADALDVRVSSLFDFSELDDNATPND